MGKVLFLPAANRDYNEARLWYLKRSERAAVRFEAAVEQALTDIKANPERWPMIDAKHRFHLLHRFPYCVVFRIEHELILIVAVAHGRRRFKYWKDR